MRFFLFFLLSIFVSASALAEETPLEARLQRLEQKVASIEARLGKVLAQLSTQRADPRGAHAIDDPLEKEAAGKFSELMTKANAGDVDAVRESFGEFVKKYGSTEVAKKRRRVLEQMSVLGKAAPDEWRIEKWFQGESEIEFEGDKPILLVFWEVWCPHCKREVPKIQKLYEERKSELSIIGLTKLSRSTTEETVKKFIDQRGLTYPMAKESGELSGYFAVRGVPAAATVKDGQVIWRGHPSQISDSLIDSWK